MKKTLVLFAAAIMMIGCDWSGKAPVVSECDKCSKCAAGCCLSGKCGTTDCDCSCERVDN
jgi:hypothetical protein